MGLFSVDCVGKLEWEAIKNTGYHRVKYLNVSRAKVFGGWIVNTISNTEAGGIGSTFIPDPKHEWKLEGIDE